MTETPEQELARLEAENEAALGWGAAVGARLERIKNLRSIIAQKALGTVDLVIRDAAAHGLGVMRMKSDGSREHIPFSDFVAVEADERAAPAQQPVKVRELEWEERNEKRLNATTERFWRAQTPIDWCYRIIIVKQKYVVRGFAGFHDTLAQAKAAAQADYERRILAALEPVAVEAARCCSAISPCSWQRHNGMDSVCPTCLAATAHLAVDQAMRVALTEAEETLRLVEHPAFPDPQYHEEVKRLGRRIGFGALMSTASAGWREVLAEAGDPVGGEFVAGPCHSTVVRALRIIRAALKQEGEPRS